MEAQNRVHVSALDDLFEILAHRLALGADFIAKTLGHPAITGRLAGSGGNKRQLSRRYTGPKRRQDSAAAAAHATMCLEI